MPESNIQNNRRVSAVFFKQALQQEQLEQARRDHEKARESMKLAESFGEKLNKSKGRPKKRSNAANRRLSAVFFRQKKQQQDIESGLETIRKIKSNASTLYPDLEQLDHSLRDFQRQFEFGESAVETVLQGRLFRHCFSLVTLLSICIFCILAVLTTTYSENISIVSGRFDGFLPIERKDVKEEFEDIGKEVVPDLEAFFYEDPSVLEKKSANTLPILGSDSSANSSCVEDAYDILKDFINNTMKFPNETNPELMKQITRMSTLDTYPPVVALLKPYFDNPKSIDQMISDSMTCAKDNRYLVALACEVMQDPATFAFQQFGLPSAEETFNLQLHFGVFLEIVTSKAMVDPSFMKGIWRHLIFEAWDKAIEKIDEYVEPEYREFNKQKVNSVFHVLEYNVEARSSDFAPKDVKKSLWLNILEAAHVDFTDGLFKDNIITALILNYNLNEEYYVRPDGTIDYYVGKEWADLYNSWNLAYVERFQKNVYFYKLLIPSVLCTADQGEHAVGFLRARATSLAISLVVSLLGSREEHDTFFAPTHQRPNSLMTLHGKVNVNESPFAFPDRKSQIAHDMFLQLCPKCHRGSTTINILNSLNEDDYRMFVQLILFLTVYFTGLGLEVQLGPRFLDFFSKSNLAWLWILAQYLFSFFTIIAILSRSIFGLPFLVIGLWKGGFPETVAYVQKCTYIFEKWDIVLFFANLCDCLGLMLHHGSSAYVVCALSIGHYQLTQELGSVLLPLVIQHWFVVVKYYSEPLYFVSELLLEFWWELEFFSVYFHFVDLKDELYDQFAPAVALCMLLAHWLYLLSALTRAFIGVQRLGSIRSYIHDLTQQRSSYSPGDGFDGHTSFPAPGNPRHDSYGTEDSVDSDFDQDDIRRHSSNPSVINRGFSHFIKKQTSQGSVFDISHDDINHLDSDEDRPKIEDLNPPSVPPRKSAKRSSVSLKSLKQKFSSSMKSI